MKKLFIFKYKYLEKELETGFLGSTVNEAQLEANIVLGGERNIISSRAATDAEEAEHMAQELGSIKTRLDEVLGQNEEPRLDLAFSAIDDAISYLNSFAQSPNN